MWEQKRHTSHTKQGFFTTGRQSSSPCNIGASSTNWWHRSNGPVCQLGMLAPDLRRIGGSSMSTWLQNSWWLKTQSWSNKWANALYPFPWSKGSVHIACRSIILRRATCNLKFLDVKSWFPADFPLSQSRDSPSRHKECNECMALRHLADVGTLGKSSYFFTAQNDPTSPVLVCIHVYIYTHYIYIHTIYIYIYTIYILYTICIYTYYIYTYYIYT